jgi:hypothetical protein
MRHEQRRSNGHDDFSSGRPTGARTNPTRTGARRATNDTRPPEPGSSRRRRRSRDSDSRRLLCIALSLLTAHDRTRTCDQRSAGTRRTRLTALGSPSAHARRWRQASCSAVSGLSLQHGFRQIGTLVRRTVVHASPRGTSPSRAFRARERKRRGALAADRRHAMLTAAAGGPVGLTFAAAAHAQTPGLTIGSFGALITIAGSLNPAAPSLGPQGRRRAGRCS